MKNILVKSVNILSSMADVISGINININKNVLTQNDIILLNEKIQLISGYFNPIYQVDWNDFGYWTIFIGIDSQVAKKYQNFKVQFAKTAYSGEPTITIQELNLTSEKWSEVYDFNDGFRLQESDSYSAGTKVYPFYFGQDNEDPNWIQNGFIKDGYQVKAKSGKVRSSIYIENTFEAIPGITYGNASITIFRLIDPNGVIYMPSNYAYFFCLTGDTLIMMSDYTQKQLKNLQIGDKILGINPQTNEFQQDEITIVSKYQDIYSDICDNWHFDNGTIIKTPKQHRFFNIQLQRFEYLNNWNIGDRIRLYNGQEAKLINHELKQQKTKCYTLFSGFNSYVANKCICGNRLSKNITPFDK